MTETDLQLGGGYTYQWECAILLALNYFLDPVRYSPILHDLVTKFLGQVTQILLEGKDRQSGVDLEDITLVGDERRILIQVKTKQADGERWTLADPLLRKALYRFYDSRFLAEQPADVRFVFLTNRPFNPDLVKIKDAIRAGALGDCPEANRLYEHLDRHTQAERGASLEVDRFRQMLGCTALVEYLAVDTVKANIQAKLQAYGRSDWKQAHALLFEHFARQSTHIGGGTVTRASIIEVLGPGPEIKELDMHAATPIITTPFNLPSALPDFTGRESQIAQLRKCLTAQDDTSIAVIRGMGGVGKTALALHVVNQLTVEGQFPDAQLYIDLRGMDPSPLDPALALNTLLTAVWGPDPCRSQDLDTLAGLWRQALHDKQYVLILDNAVNPQQVRPLLPTGPLGAVMVTSRSRFTLPGAFLLDLSRMEREEASILLQKLSPRLLSTEARQIAELCGRLPLALRIAGNYLRLNEDCTAQEYVARLSDERHRLAQLRDPTDPELDVAATLSLSVAQLDGETRQAWSLLHLFLAPFDDTAAATLWGSTERMTRDQLPEYVAAQYGTDQTDIIFAKRFDENKTRERLRFLRNRSLVSFDSASRRHQMHDLLRLLAVEEAKVLPASDLAGAYNRMVSHYVFAANVANTFQRYSDLDPDWPHCLLALGVAQSESDHTPEFLSTLVLSLCGYWSARGMARTKRFWCSRAAAACSAAGRFQQMARHLVNLGDALRQSGLLREASEIYAEALSITREIGDQRLEADVLSSKSTIIVSRKDALVAIKGLKAALAIHQALGAKGAVESDLGRLGNAFLHLHELDQATECFSQAIQIAQEIGDQKGEADWLGNLGSASIQSGDWEKARNSSERALVLHRKMGDRPGEATNLFTLGQALANLDDLPNALVAVETALGIWRAIGNANKEAACLHTIASIQSLSGDMPGAAGTYREALEVWQRTPERAGPADALDELGRVCTILGDTEEGIRYLDDAIAISREIGDLRRQSRSLLKLGIAHAATGEYQCALDCFGQALYITLHTLRSDSKGSLTWPQTCQQVAIIHETLGTTYLDTNHPDKALEHLKKAFLTSHAIRLAQSAGSQGWKNACVDEETHLGLLAHVCAIQGRTEEAIAYYEEGFEIALLIEDEYSTVNCLLNLGSLAATQGNNTRAREKWTEALKLVGANDDPTASTIRQWLSELDE